MADSIPKLLGRVLRLAVADGTPKRAIQVALVVGSILVMINQWNACFGPGHIDWVKAVLTYMVPYSVSTFTSVAKDLQDTQP